MVKTIISTAEQATASGVEFLRSLIQEVDKAMANIEPDNAEQHQGMALLIGRPMALVRASLDLELQGCPAIHQGWNQFRQDLARNSRDSDGFTEVDFPIRIGEYRQLNDGLVGYWIEDEIATETGEIATVYEDDLFYVPQSKETGSEDEELTDDVKSDFIVTRDEALIHLHQSLAAPPRTLAMLMDPRCLIHATCGVLPTVSVFIPPDQYVDALQAIEVTFLTTPLLTNQNQVRIALPTEPGYKWAWLEKGKVTDDGNGTDTVWTEISTTGTVMKQAFEESFEQAEGIWELLLNSDYGWIQEIEPGKAAVVPTDQRATDSLADSSYAEQQAAIELLLDRSYIGQVSAKADFAGTQEIREGWLKLSVADA